MGAHSPKRVTKATSEKKLYSGNLCASETYCGRSRVACRQSGITVRSPHPMVGPTQMARKG